MVRKAQLPVIGGIRKVITVPGSNVAVGTTIAEVGSGTITLAQLATAITNVQAQQQNTGGGNIGDGTEATLVPGPGLAGGGPMLGSVGIRLVAPIPWGLDDGGGGGDGDIGPPGMAGLPGTNGATGMVGPMGPAIFMAAQDGQDGQDAIPGNPGQAGAPGANGATGGVGPMGPAIFMAGDDGQDGDVIPGPPGPQGAPGSGSTNPFNIAPESHTSTPTFVQNDEFEQTAGTAIDTAGTRFAGATAWIWGNQGSATALQSGDGNIILTAQNDGNLHGVYQPASGVFKRRAKFSLYNTVRSAGDFAGIFAYNSGTGHIVSFGFFPTSGPTYTFAVLKWSSFTAFSSVGYNALPYQLDNSNLWAPLWFELRSDGTTLTFAISTSGVNGAFIDVTTETIATFLTTVDNAGLCVDSNSTPASAMVADLWRKY